MSQPSREHVGTPGLCFDIGGWLPFERRFGDEASASQYPAQMLESCAQISGRSRRMQLVRGPFRDQFARQLNGPLVELSVPGAPPEWGGVSLPPRSYDDATTCDPGKGVQTRG